jgi:uncharacterized protein
MDNAMAGEVMRRVLAGAMLGLTMVWLPHTSAQANDSEAASAPARIWESRQVDYVSQVTGRPYRLLISLPEAPPPPEGYPVVYVTDGALYFGTVTETARLQGLNFYTPPLVVAIAYQEEGTRPALTLRMKDLSLPIDAASIETNPLFTQSKVKAEDTGGLDDYLTMLRTEVRSWIVAEYPVDLSRQVIFGHSLGGLAVLRQLLGDPAAYSGYIASAPSIWYKDKAVLADLDGLPDLLRPLSKAPTLILMVGGDEEDLPRIAPDNPTLPATVSSMSTAELLEGLRISAMVTNVQQLHERLSQIDNLHVTTVVFPDEDHASVVPAAISRGLRLTLTK